MNLIKGGGTRASKTNFDSRSSRTDNEVTAFDADVDEINIEEEDTSKSDKALTEEKMDVSAVRSQRTEANESADDFILARKTVVRFVQDSIAEAVDKQKTICRQEWKGKHSFIQ